MTNTDQRGLEQLALELQDIGSIERCAEVCCAHFTTPELDLASVYLFRSGRLRRYASLGYWQVLDGITPDHGVIAATATSGQPHLIDVATSSLYLMAAQCAVAEACVPIFSEGESIGALNLEAPVPISPSILGEMAEVAGLLGDRIAQLGGVDEPRGWRLLADRTAPLMAATDELDAVKTALDISSRIVGADGVMFVKDLGGGGLLPLVSCGDVGPLMMELSQEALGTLSVWVTGPTSCYTVGDPEAPGFTGHDSLRLHGVSAIATTAVGDGDHRVGFFVAGHLHREMPTVDQIEQLEVLAAVLGGAIRNIRHIEELLAETRRDPLTGLGHSKAFDDRLRALEHEEDRATVVFSVDVDHFKSVNDTLGHEAGDERLRSVATALASALRGDDTVFRVGGDEFAVVVSVDDERQATAIGDRLLTAVRGTGMRVSVGGAVARFGGASHRDVFALADAALYDAKRQGRDRLVMNHDT